MEEQKDIGYRKYNSQISSRRQSLSLISIYIHGAGHLRLVDYIKRLSTESIGSNIRQVAKISRCYYSALPPELVIWVEDGFVASVYTIAFMKR